MNALIGIKIGYNNVLGNENVYFLGQTVRLCFDIQKGTTSEFMFTFWLYSQLGLKSYLKEYSKSFQTAYSRDIYKNIDKGQ